MNNKELFLQTLHNARIEHTKWLSKMRILSTGEVDGQYKCHSSFFDTNFALWFQEKATFLLYEHQLTALREVEKLIQHLDGEHTLLYNIAIKKRAKTLLGKIKPFTSSEEKAAEKYFNSIKIISEKIETLLDESSRIIHAMDVDKFSFMLVKNEDTTNTSTKDDTSEKSYGGARGSYYQ